MDTFNHTLSRFLNFFSALLVIAALYLGQKLLVPLALACLFTFLLNPLVKILCRWRLHRVASVGVVTLVSFSILALVAWLLGGELAGLANDLPNHRHNIQKRVESLQQVGETRVIQRLRKLVGDVSQPTLAAPEPNAAPTEIAAVAAPQPPPETATALMTALNMVVPTLAEAMGTTAVVVLFVIFMLLRLDDIGQRVARLVGYSRLTLTTKAIDETGERISRYLLMQGTVNAIYGLMLGIGLAVIGLPYVILWGVLAAIFRFIPYVGPWIVAVLPISLSLAVFDGWAQPLVVIALIVTLELLTNMILEPMLYGHSVGVSDFALLLAIAFWTWLWGGVGLVLATPLTVCIVVFCKHIPALEWVDIVMGENPLPQPHLSYYQHHLANNEDAAQALLETSMRKDGLETTLEAIALPALALTRHEEVLGKLDPDEAAQIYQGMRSAFTLLSDSTDEAARVKTSAAGNPSAIAEAPSATQPALQVFGRALHGEPDVQALEMLAAVLPPAIAIEISADPRLIGELVHELGEKQPALVCISSLPPQARLVVSTLCRRLHSKLPDLKILVCRWGLTGQEFDPKPLHESGATWVVSSIKEAREVLEGVIV
ncbi:AI-2E family transporter [Prosthecobacter sp.]|uniref:AI-2E family transporter n=1 Tax=Prosthecobacter sp. TaxID=1965333 RepID=UPI002ABB48E4|nr:AI-2E family transporter [Prosthecobacter sp.]MDZ4401178.1 AI-2E family transporter [Prosthecobacter sp.]